MSENVTVSQDITVRFVVLLERPYEGTKRLGADPADPDAVPDCFDLVKNRWGYDMLVTKPFLNLTLNEAFQISKQVNGYNSNGTWSNGRLVPLLEPLTMYRNRLYIEICFDNVVRSLQTLNVSWEALRKLEAEVIEVTERKMVAGTLLSIASHAVTLSQEALLRSGLVEPARKSSDGETQQ